MLKVSYQGLQKKGLALPLDKHKMYYIPFPC